MGASKPGDADALLARVLEADRALRAARDALLEIGDDKGTLAAIDREIERAFATQDDEEASERLIRVSDLLLDIGGAEAPQSLLRVLGHEDPSVRVAAGESLTELLFDRFAEVARVIEAEITRGTNTIALTEVPFILAEVGEPGGVKLLARLLSHSDADVVGAAIEGLAAMSDPSALKQLEALRSDTRKVMVEDETEGAGEVTVGDLAAEAIDHLRRQKS